MGRRACKEAVNSGAIRFLRLKTGGPDATRELLFGNYGIVYKIKGETLYVLTIRHFKQVLPLEEAGDL